MHLLNKNQLKYTSKTFTKTELDERTRPVVSPPPAHEIIIITKVIITNNQNNYTIPITIIINV